MVTSEAFGSGQCTHMSPMVMVDLINEAARITDRTFPRDDHVYAWYSAQSFLNLIRNTISGQDLADALESVAFITWVNYVQHKYFLRRMRARGIPGYENPGPGSPRILQEPTEWRFQMLVIEGRLQMGYPTQDF